MNITRSFTSPGDLPRDEEQSDEFYAAAGLGILRPSYVLPFSLWQNYFILVYAIP